MVYKRISLCWQLQSYPLQTVSRESNSVWREHHTEEVRVARSASVGTRAVSTRGTETCSDFKTLKVPAQPREKRTGQRRMSTFWWDGRQGPWGVRTRVELQRDLTAVPECADHQAPAVSHIQPQVSHGLSALSPTSLPTSSLSVLHQSTWLPYQLLAEIKPGFTTSKIVWYNSLHKHNLVNIII